MSCGLFCCVFLQHFQFKGAILRRALDTKNIFSLTRPINVSGLCARCRCQIREAALTDSSSLVVAAPLYEQVQKAIRSRILAGEWTSREAMPGEVSLSQEFGVSIGTVRKAMDQLMRENIVVRERGRGTFVRREADWRSGLVFRLKDLNGAPLSASVSLVGWRAEPANPEEVRLLRQQGSAAKLQRSLKLAREWHLSGNLLCRETIVVDDSRFPGLPQSPGLNTETLFTIYSERYRVVIDAIRWEIGAAFRVGEHAAIGAETLKGPTISIQRLAIDQRGEPMELCEQLVSLAHCSVELGR